MFLERKSIVFNGMVKFFFSFMFKHEIDSCISIPGCDAIDVRFSYLM